MKNLLLLLLLPLKLWAIPEENYVIEWKEKVFPHFVSLQTGEFENSAGLNIRFHYSINRGAKKTIVILPGRAEPAIKYAEVLYDLRAPDVNFFVIDHQGQGESDRILDDSHKGHVLHFQNYVEDLRFFMTKVVIPQTQGSERFLLAHSMGGTIGVHYLASHPGVFKKVVLSAPMLKLNTRPYAEIVAKIYSLFLMKSGKGAEYAPDKGPYVAEEDTFEKNLVTHSRERFEVNKSLFRDYPFLTVGGPTVQWVHSSLKATSRIQNLGKKIKIPILILQSGNDEYVKNERQNSFCKKAFDCQRVIYPQAFHEILMEKDVVRSDAMKRLQFFFN